MLHVKRFVPAFCMCLVYGDLIQCSLNDISEMCDCGIPFECVCDFPAHYVEMYSDLSNDLPF